MISIPSILQNAMASMKLNMEGISTPYAIPYIFTPTKITPHIVFAIGTSVDFCTYLVRSDPRMRPRANPTRKASRMTRFSVVILFLIVIVFVGTSCGKVSGDYTHLNCEELFIWIYLQESHDDDGNDTENKRYWKRGGEEWWFHILEIKEFFYEKTPFHCQWFCIFLCHECREVVAEVLLE